MTARTNKVPKGAEQTSTRSAARFSPPTLAISLTLSLTPAPAQAAQAEGSRAPEPMQVRLDGNSLTIDQICGMLRSGFVEVTLADEARQRMQEYRKGALGALEAGQRVYGWNQALGPLKDKALSLEEQREFQQHILRSHAAGVGPPFPDAVARLGLVIEANSMARGTFGVRPELVDRLLAMVNKEVLPSMPQIGSLGTADLQPMAEAGLVAMGEKAPATFRGRRGDADEILARANLPGTFVFEAGEALPLMSGNSLLTAGYAHAVRRAETLADLSEGAFALFLEATRAESGQFDERTQVERRIPAQVDAAARVRALIRGSGWMTEEGRKRLDDALGIENHPRIQDAVTVRAAPHIFGAFRQTLDEARTILAREANASTSNPLIFPRKDGKGFEFVPGGNWDAAQMGHAIDLLNAQVADLGVLDQELSARLLSDKWSYGLPPNLVGGKVGLNSGMVQVQTVAVALIPEMQVRAVPAGILSRPAKFGQEDHNPMTMASLRNLNENLERLEIVVAVELLMAAQGIDLIRDKMKDLPLGDGTEALHAVIRRHIPALGEDRYMSPDLEEMISLVRGRQILGAVREAVPLTGSRCGG